MLNKQIKSLRKKKGWSQAEFAQRLHISPSTIGMYEQGRREPSVSVLIAMSEEFGVTLDYLMTGKVCILSNPRIGEQTGHIRDALVMLNDLSSEERLILLVTILQDQ